MQATRLLDDGFVADAGDGCRPASTTIVGQDIAYDAFRDALAGAEVGEYKGTTGVQYFAVRSCG